MKSFGKTFRTFLAMSLVLCMVMSCVTVSADAVTLSEPTIIGTPDSNGYYQVQYTVGGISAVGGNATILVYDADKGGINNDSIEYANQMPVSDGSATFTMLLDNGNYAVLAGGTGLDAAATDEVTTGSAPTVTVTPVTPNINNEAAAGTKVADFTIVDKDGAANVETVELSGTGSENFAVVWTKGEATGEIQVAANAALTATTYSGLVLTATDAEEMEGPATFGITVAAAIIPLTVTQPSAFGVAYGTSATDAVSGITTLGTDKSVGVNVSWTAPDAYGDGTTPGTYTFTGAVVNPDSTAYEVTNPSLFVDITVNTAKVTAFASLDGYTAAYGASASEVAAALKDKYPTVIAKYDGGKETTFTVTAWNIDEYDGTVEGEEYTFTADYDLPEAFELSGAVEAPTVLVTVGIEPTTYINSIVADDSNVDKTFGYGTKEADIIAELAKNVTVTGTTEKGTIDLTLAGWKCDNFAEGVYNEFTFTAEAQLPAEGKYKFACDTTTVSVTVTVKDDRTIITNEDIDLSPSMITVDWGTSREEVLAELAKVVAKYNESAEEDALEIDHATWTEISGTFDGKANANFSARVSVKDEYADKYVIENGYINQTVAIFVNDNRTVIKSIECDTKDIEVAYGTEPTLPEISLVDKDGNKIALNDVSWEKGGFDANTPGEYTFTTTVDVQDTNKYKFEVEVGTNVISVNVTVASNVYVAEEGKTSTLSEGTYTVTEFGTPVDAVLASGEGTVLNITGGSFDGGQTKGGLGNTAVWATKGAVVNISGGSFTIGDLPEGGEGHIDLIYASKGGKVYITGGTFTSVSKYVWAANAKDKDGSLVQITGGTFIGWNPADPGFVYVDGNGQDASGYVDQPAYVPETHTVELIAENTWEVVPKKEVNTIEPIVVYLLEGHEDDYTTTFENKVNEGIIKDSVDVVVDGITYTISNITWPDEEEAGFEYWPFADAEENPFVVKALPGFTVPDDLKLDGDAVPSIMFAVIPSDFDFEINGLEGKSSVVAKVGEDVTIDATYNNKFDVPVEYMYAVSGTSEAPTEWKVVPDDGNITDDIPDVDKASKKITVKATVAGYELAEKAKYVFRQLYAVDGAIYISSEGLWPADEAVKYSSLRVSKNRDMQVKFDLVDANGQTLSLDNVTYEVKLNDVVVNATVENGIITIDKSYLASYASGAACTVSFTCKDANGNVLFTRNRNTHVTDANTLWYTDFKVDGAARGGIRVRRDAGLKYYLELDGVNPATNSLYSGLKLVKYANKAIANGAETLTSSGAKIEGILPLDSYVDNGSYVLYGLANLESAKQDYYDFKFSRTIYLYNTYTNVCGLYLNGSSSNQAPKATDGKISILPHLGGANIDPNHTYHYTLTLTNAYTGEPVNVLPENVEGAASVVGNVITSLDFTTPIVISNATPAVLTKGIRVAGEAFVDGAFDKVFNKVFYTYNITNVSAE